MHGDWTLTFSATKEVVLFSILTGLKCSSATEILLKENLLHSVTPVFSTTLLTSTEQSDYRPKFPCTLNCGSSQQASHRCTHGSYTTWRRCLEVMSLVTPWGQEAQPHLHSLALQMTICRLKAIGHLTLTKFTSENTLSCYSHCSMAFLHLTWGPKPCRQPHLTSHISSYTFIGFYALKTHIMALWHQFPAITCTMLELEICLSLGEAWSYMHQISEHWVPPPLCQSTPVSHSATLCSTPISPSYPVYGILSSLPHMVCVPLLHQGSSTDYFLQSDQSWVWSTALNLWAIRLEVLLTCCFKKCRGCSWSTGHLIVYSSLLGTSHPPCMTLLTCLSLHRCCLTRPHLTFAFLPFLSVPVLVLWVLLFSLCYMIKSHPHTYLAAFPKGFLMCLATVIKSYILPSKHS